ncbi:hypothetical protein RQP55_07680 [Novosphingobium sp. APW14]|jgi:hypothetical protein|uniref:hypothetical protein n=1 Tax=Novosphingobium sp. APW14 TaxID=3077237 RepID=UPI0028DE4C70|nr:hypothetical protein [Novosphingobium sp. APW14]MDT9013300.1 hypothetical protein [Novosphingobium sp. APW14]
MSRAAPLFALLAILPAALHAAPVMAGDSLLVPICTGDGQTRLVAIPKGGTTPRRGGEQDCVKGCHAGSSRKRTGAPQFEPAQ